MPDLPEQPWELLKQPDQRSCGAASMVVARMLADPAYAAFLAGSEGPVGLAFPRTVAGDAELRERFKAETLAMHRRITGLADVSGKPQIPWPRTFGTPPWAVARQLSGTPAADGTLASLRLARGADAACRRPTSACSTQATATGSRPSSWAAPGCRGTSCSRSTPPCAAPSTSMTRARGQVSELRRLAFLRGEIDIAGWDVAWFVVTPDA